MIEGTMQVHNVNGADDHSCSPENRLDHWKKFSGSPLPLYCPESTCHRKPEAGALVQKDSHRKSNWYVVPLCRKHYAETGKSLDIFYLPLVPANAAKTSEE